MQEQLIKKEIAKKLKKKDGGNCPYDPSCSFGIGVNKCSASKEELQKKFNRMKNECDSERNGPGLFAVGSLDADWPCLMCSDVHFVMPASV